MNEDRLQKIIQSLTYHSNPDLKRNTPKSVWRVKVNGQFISTASNKTVWKEIGHAKNAIINHIDNSQANDNPRSNRLDGKEVLQELMRCGVIEFIEFPIDIILK